MYKRQVIHSISREEDVPNLRFRAYDEALFHELADPINAVVEKMRLCKRRVLQMEKLLDELGKECTTDEAKRILERINKIIVKLEE